MNIIYEVNMLMFIGGVSEMGFLRRILEGIIINLLWWIIQAAIVAVPFIVVAANPDILLNGILCFLIAITAVAMCWLVWYFGGRYYPPLTWDIIHGDNSYTLTYETREKASYQRNIEAIPLRKNIKEFKDGEYRWSGDSNDPFIVESDYKILFNKINNRTEYVVCPQMIVQKYKPLRYTLGLNLQDTNRVATPTNFIYIKRPTKKITLVVKMAVTIPIRNVRYLARTKYGEENKLIHKKGNPIEENGYNIYTFMIRKPKLFCEYEIRWDWSELIPSDTGILKSGSVATTASLS
jgi:hypothetical protein